MLLRRSNGIRHRESPVPVPWEIVEELESAGYVGSATDLVVKGGIDVGDLTVSPAG
jgi:hypothetical protein